MMEAPERLKRATADGETDQQRQLAEHINSLLAKWHIWCACQKEVDGYKKRCSMFLDVLAAKHFETEAGDVDSYVDIAIIEGFDAQVEQIDQPWKTAIQIQARNLATGSSVWYSARLPACDHARRLLLVEARTMLISRLAMANML